MQIAEKNGNSTTLKAAAFSNYQRGNEIPGGSSHQFFSLAPHTIKADLIKLSDQTLGQHPKRLGGVLYLPVSGGQVIWPEDAHELFAWVHSLCPDDRDRSFISWHSNNDCITKREFFSYLAQTAEVADWAEFLQDLPNFAWPRPQDRKIQVSAEFTRLISHSPRLHAQVFFLHRFDKAEGSQYTTDEIYGIYQRWACDRGLSRHDQLTVEALTDQMKEIPNIQATPQFDVATRKHTLLFSGIRLREKPCLPCKV